MQKLFVYGTLKKGFSNHNRIFGGYDITITPAWIYGELYDLGYFPALTIGKNKVYGELIEFEKLEILPKIDSLEGFKGKHHSNNFYERHKTQVFVKEKELIAWVYKFHILVIRQYYGRTIHSGVWTGYKKSGKYFMNSVF